MNAQPAGGKTIEAKPVLRNKIAEITRFVPTSLLVRRGAGTTPGTGSVNDTTTTSTTSVTSSSSLSSSNESHYHYNQHHQPYDYMSQQQQTYSNLNPLMSSGGSRPKTTGDNYGLEQPKSTTTTTTTTTKLASTDAAYESFMKEIGKLL